MFQGMFISLIANTGNAALQKQWSSSEFLICYVHVGAQFIQTNDLYRASK